MDGYTHTQTHSISFCFFPGCWVFVRWLDEFRPRWARTWSVLDRLDLHLWPALLPDVLPSFLPPYSSQLGTGPRRTWSAAPQRLHRNSTTAMDFSIFFPGVKTSWTDSLHSPWCSYQKGPRLLFHISTHLSNFCGSFVFIYLFLNVK